VADELLEEVTESGKLTHKNHITLDPSGTVVQVRIVRMRNRGVEIDRRVLRDAAGTRGQLAITETTDHGKHRR